MAGEHPNTQPQGDGMRWAFIMFFQTAYFAPIKHGGFFLVSLLNQKQGSSPKVTRFCEVFTGSELRLFDQTQGWLISNWRSWGLRIKCWNPTMDCSKTEVMKCGNCFLGLAKGNQQENRHLISTLHPTCKFVSTSPSVRGWSRGCWASFAGEDRRKENVKEWNLKSDPHRLPIRRNTSGK